MFSRLSLNKAGDYRFLITDGNFSAQTVKFTVSAGAAADLAFVQPPTDVKAGRVITPAITVSVADADGNPVSGQVVKLAVASGPTGSVLGGTLKAVAQDGVATFTNVALTKAGSYTLEANHASVKSAASASFNVSPVAAAKLAFVQQPSRVAAGAMVTPAVVVGVEDKFGNLVTTNDSQVTLSIKASPTGAILGGAIMVAASDGEATFSDLLLDPSGAYTLSAADGDLARARSIKFRVSPTA
ncbi:MAG: hypothetical protein ABSH22_03350 [Tepidisphaeraceae bacterium]|jgi:hypothetical protein